MSKGEIQCDVTVGADDEYRHLVDLLGKVLDQPHRGVVHPVEVVQSVDSRLVAAGTGKEFLFDDRGDTELRGFEGPVQVYEVRWREE